ncbi:hypothetical protein ACNKHT_18640 [Shigella flexneri]
MSGVPTDGALCAPVRRVPSWRWWATPRIPFTRGGAGGNLAFMDAAELIAELKRLHRQGKTSGRVHSPASL